MGLDQDSGMSFVRFENRLPAQNKVKWSTKGCRWRLKGKIPILDVCENKQKKSGPYITAGRKYVAKIAKDDIMPLMIIYVSAIYRPWSHLSLSSILVFGDKWSSPPKRRMVSFKHAMEWMLSVCCVSKQTADLHPVPSAWCVGPSCGTPGPCRSPLWTRARCPCCCRYPPHQGGLRQEYARRPDGCG